VKFTQGNMFMNEMYVNLNVFRPPMVHQVAGHVDGRDIVVEGHRSTVDQAMDLAQKLLKSDALGSSISHHAVFCLRVGAGHCGLAFAGPRHQGFTKEDEVARRKSSGVGAAGPIGVGVDRKRSQRRSAQMKTERRGTMDIIGYA
jgi:hypothetical protein